MRYSLVLVLVVAPVKRNRSQLPAKRSHQKKLKWASTTAPTISKIPISTTRTDHGPSPLSPLKAHSRHSVPFLHYETLLAEAACYSLLLFVAALLFSILWSVFWHGHAICPGVGEQGGPARCSLLAQAEYSAHP